MRNKFRLVMNMVLLAVLVGLVFTGCSGKQSETAAGQQSVLESSSEPQTKGVDPFKNLMFDLVGNNGEATLRSTTARVLIKTDAEDYLLLIRAEIPENNGSVSNGDLIHVSISESEIKRIKEMYGIEFSRTEADIAVHGLNAYGTPAARDGEYGVIHLNDYLKFYGDRNCIQAVFNYSMMVQDFTHSISENVSDQILNPGEPGRYEVDRILSVHKPFEARLVCVSEDGCYATFTWEIDEEALAMLKNVMNIDITYEDYVYEFKE